MTEIPGLDLVRDVVIQQQRGSNGHYRILPLSFSVPAASARYKDFVVPDYTNGMDFMSFHVHCGDFDSGDEIVAGKLIAGKIGSVGVGAATGDVEVLIASTSGILQPTAEGGKIDEGYYLSFGSETSTDATVNADTSGDVSNPNSELREYEIKRIGAETPIGGGNSIVPITLFSPLAADISAGTAANLVIRVAQTAIPVVKGDILDVGMEYLQAGNVPPGRRLRVGFRNSSATEAKEFRGTFRMLY